MSEDHRLKQWLAAADAEIRASYEENHAKAQSPSRVQQTGHAAERAWGQLLEHWLPPQYEVAYRRYILPEVETESYQPRETDLVVLRPGYPDALRGKEEVLAAGVAAAFSVKLTLDSGGLGEAIEEAAHVRQHTAPRLGTPRQELTLPFRYGVLGHAHDFGVNARENVAKGYWRNDLKFSRHPRESLDLICIADLGVWSKLAFTWMPIWDEEERIRGNLVADHYSPQTTLFDNQTSCSKDYPLPEESESLASDLSPLAVFISVLYSYLAEEDEVAEPFYRGLLGSGASGSGMGTSRDWTPSDVYHESTLAGLPARLVYGRDREWGSAY